MSKVFCKNCRYMDDSHYINPRCLKNKVYTHTHPCYGDLYVYQDCADKNSLYNCKDFKPNLMTKIKNYFKR